MIPCAALFEWYGELLWSCDLWWHGMSCKQAKKTTFVYPPNLTSDLHPWVCSNKLKHTAATEISHNYS